MIDQRYNGIISNFNDYSYHILGCGAIGSSAATQICRMGAREIYLYDMDKVGMENIGVSMYGQQHIGKPKVEALSEILADIEPNCNVNTFDGYFNGYDVQENNIIVLGFDSMDSRKGAVETIVKQKRPDVLIDGRMGAEIYQQYTFKNPTFKQYIKTWYSDEDGSDEPCNAKATSYCSNMSGSLICNTIKKILKEEMYHSQFAFSFPTMLFNYGELTK